MGREVKRVPLDFEWQLNKTWSGYVNPHYAAHSWTCRDCTDYKGASPEMTRLYKLWYGYTAFRPEDRGSTPYSPDHPIIRAFAERNVTRSPDYYGKATEWVIAHEASRLCDVFNQSWSHHLNDDDVKALVDENRLFDFTHDYLPGFGWKKKKPAYMPTAREVNDWSLTGMGHDSINQWIVTRAECERLGHDTKCKKCEGEGLLWDSPEHKIKCEEWVREDPPVGDGWQMWETTSEGSPISPVFASPEILALWLSDTGASSFGDDTASYEEWMRMIVAGWAPSSVMVNGVMSSGVKHAGTR